MAEKTIRVRAGDGLSIPLPGNLAVDTGITVLTPETSVDVIHNLYTRRRLLSGDFVLVEGEATPPRGEGDITAEINAEPLVPPVDEQPATLDAGTRHRRASTPWSDEPKGSR